MYQGEYLHTRGIRKALRICQHRDRIDTNTFNNMGFQVTPLNSEIKRLRLQQTTTL